MQERAPSALLLALCFALACPAAAERLELDDGSVVVGVLRGLAGGFYTVESEGLGLIEIPSSRVKRIDGAAPAPPASATGSQAGADVSELQQQMLSDGRIVGQLLALGETPEMQAILSDPELMALVQSGNLEALGRHPKILKLLESPHIGEIGGALGR